MPLVAAGWPAQHAPATALSGGEAGEGAQVTLNGKPIDLFGEPCSKPTCQGKSLQEINVVKATQVIHTQVINSQTIRGSLIIV